MSQEEVKRYHVERHCSIVMRALADRKNLELRHQNIYLDDKIIGLFVPYLYVDAVADSYQHNCGCSDAVALRIKHCDFSLHSQLTPKNTLSRVIFDTLEQLRCEALLDSHYVGVRENINFAFNQWCRDSRGNGLTENELGLLIYSVIQIVRSRLLNIMQDEEVEGLIESVRFRLAPVIGDDILQLQKNKSNQFVYAQAALNIAAAVEEIASSFGDDLHEQKLAALRHKNLLPPINITDTQNTDSQNQVVTQSAIDQDSGYHVFCHEFDKQVQASDLYRLQQRKKLRQSLDETIASEAISIHRLALRMRKVFATPQPAGWRSEQEEGYLDGRLLSQLVARQTDRRIFKQERLQPMCDTALTFLIDNSGSMKSQYQSVAVLIDIYVRALQLAGVDTEVLGFTTGGWTGGRSIKLWQQQNAPANPGRLNDRLHIIYKSFSESWRQSRLSLCTMMNSLHFKEGLDGEAIQWASERLLQTTASRKCLVVVSDGSPMDSATDRYNQSGFLAQHLQSVIHKIELNTSIEMKAISIDLDVRNFFAESICLDLTGTLDNTAFGVLETLFARRR